MKRETGYVLIIVILIICLITFATVLLANRSIFASYFAVLRLNNVPALALAENAAREGYWQLAKAPTYRSTQSRYWGSDWYRFSIIDATPANPADDLSLQILGEGFTGNQQRKVRLYLTRPNLNTYFTINAWNEES